MITDHSVLFAELEDGVIYSDTEGIILSANPAAERIFNIPAGKITGLNLIDAGLCCHREDGSRIEPEKLSRWGARADDDPLRGIIIRYDYGSEGKSIWLHVKTAPCYKDGDAAPYRYCSILRDITKEKEAEEQILKSEERFKGIWETAPDALFIFDPDLKITQFNARSLTLFRYTPAEYEGKDIGFLFPENEKRRIETKIRNAVEQNNIAALDGTIINCVCNDGSLFPAELRFSQQRVEDKICTLLIVRDISKRKELELKQIESETRYKTFIDQTHDLVQSVAPDGKYIFVNETWKRTLGYDDNEIETLNLFDIIHEDSVEHCSVSFNRIKEGESLSGMNLSIKTKSGKKLFVEGAAFPVWHEGKVVATHAFFKDVTARIMIEAALREANEKFTEMSESIEELFWMYDHRVKRIVYASAAFERIWGISREEVYKESPKYKSTLHPDDVEKLNIELRKQANGEKTDVEYRIISQDGSVRWMLDRSFPIFDERGKLIRTTGIAADITAKKNSEELLRASESKLRALINSQTSYVLRTDLEGAYIYCNNKFKEEFLWNNPEQEISGYNLINSVCSYHQERARSVIRECINTPGAVYRVELDKLAIGEVIKTALWEFICLTDSDGKPGELQCMGIDISERKEAENALNKERAFLDQLIQNAPEAIVVTDSEERVLRVNEEFIRLFGFTPSEAEGKYINELVTTFENLNEAKAISSHVRTGDSISLETVRNRKDGTRVDVIVSVAPVVVSGIKVGLIGIYHDISERKRLFRELMAAKEKAEEVNKIKSYFFANMSHELRTPFVGILGFSDLLSQSLTNPEDLELIEGISSSSKRMMETLDKMLAYTNLEFNTTPREDKDFDVKKVIADNYSHFIPQARKKGLQYEVDNLALPLIIKSDQHLFSSVINKLISNAIIFTASGKVSIAASFGKRNGEPILTVRVSDTGIGIPKDKQKIIWDEFRQASEGHGRNFEGTGLGLTIAKKYAEILGGDISLKSESGKGSTFSFELPLNQILKEVAEELLEEHTSVKNEHFEERREKRILLIEDDDLTQKLISRIVRGKYRLDIAGDADKAIELTEKNNYEILLIDIDLRHGLDGASLMERLRTLPKYTETPMIAVTAFASESDKEEFIERGFSHYVAKPFAITDLLKLIDELAAG